MEEYKKKILEEMEEIPKEWKEKVYFSSDKLYYTRYGLGRDFTEGYDYILVYFKTKMSIKIFLNKHHESCF